MIRRPPRSTLDRSSAASDVYKRQDICKYVKSTMKNDKEKSEFYPYNLDIKGEVISENRLVLTIFSFIPVSYTHLRAHETVLDIVCRLLLEKNKQTKKKKKNTTTHTHKLDLSITHNNFAHSTIR